MWGTHVGRSAGLDLGTGDVEGTPGTSGLKVDN